MGAGKVGGIGGGDLSYNNENTNGGINTPKVGSGKVVGFVTANIYQAATLNKLLPRGFKIDLVDIVQKNTQQRLA